MNTDTRQTVKPVVGHHAELRNGIIVPNIRIDPPDIRYWSEAFVTVCTWDENGKSSELWSDLDIIATISPQAMALAAYPVQAVVRHTDRFASLETLIPLADAVLDHADSHCRAFPIATAPNDRKVMFWNNVQSCWEYFAWPDINILSEKYTHWREPLPPPSNPPLPAVFVELGAALEKIKGEGK
jgi:hypothetical protein